MGEQILSVRRGCMPSEWLGLEVSLRLSGFPSEVLSPDVIEWVSRETAETDFARKQIIPYCLADDGTGHFACYPRKGSEGRLHGLWSLGIGGHVNPTDCLGDGEFEGICRRGLLRELSEEFMDFDPAGCLLEFLGLINEERTDVGKVHLGLVYRAVLRGRPAPGEELGGLVWLDTKAFAEYEMELWSRLAVGCLGL